MQVIKNDVYAIVNGVPDVIEGVLKLAQQKVEVETEGRSTHTWAARSPEIAQELQRRSRPPHT